VILALPAFVGSPITFSGFNNIDFSAIVDAVMTQESQPLTRLQTQKSTLDTQNTQFGTLATKLSSMKSAADALSDVSSMALVSASSSDTGVGVSTTSGTVAGSYQVEVTQLARPQVLKAATDFTATTDVVATGGGITFTPAVGAAKTISVTASTTVAGLAAAINGASDCPVTASVVQTTPGHYSLVFTSKETGSDNAFTITSTLGAGLTLPDDDSDGISGDDLVDLTQEAKDASLKINNLQITSSSNVVTDAIPGATLTLKTEGATATIGVTRDIAGAKSLVNKFITAYNDLVTFAKDQATAAAAGKANIARDPVLQGLRGSLGEAMRDTYLDGGAYDALAKVGIGFDTNGKAVLDSTVLEDALSDSVTDVQGLFSGTDGTGGAFGAINALIDNYTKAGGLVASAKDRISTQVQSMQKRLDDLQARLAVRRQTLQQEYTAADLAMSRLKSQSSSLSSVGSGYRLF
jgi:flagellar hook-associated protein 2